MKIKTIKLQNIKCFEKLEIKDLNKHQLIILVGENGSGKSTIFDVLNLVFSYIFNNNWLYNTNELLSNDKNDGQINIELTLDENETKEPQSDKNIFNIQISLSRSNNRFNVINQEGIVQIREIIDKRYNREILANEKNVENFGIYIHRSPYRYEDVQDINEPQRNSLNLTEDRGRISTKAQVQSSRWNIVLSYFLQLNRIIKSKYFAVNNDNLTSAISELEESTKKFSNLIDDFNFLLENKKIANIEETVTEKTYFWVKNTIKNTNVEFKQLSSGEKEALFLFSDIRRQSPKNSIIAIDEPDLHLHYNLQRKILQRFNDIGQNNQIFLTTHSLAIVKEAGKYKNSVVYNFNSENQPKEVKTRSDFLELYKILADDLADILTNGVVVFVEGNNTEADAKIYDNMINDPNIHFIPARDRTKVNSSAWISLHLVSQQTTPQKLCAITDGDGRLKEEKENLENNLNNLLLVLSKYSIESYFFDFELWEKIDNNSKKDDYKNFNADQYRTLIKNELIKENEIDKAVNIIIGSRNRIETSKLNNPIGKDEIKRKISESLSNDTYLEIYPMKKIFNEMIPQLFNINPNDFKQEIIKLMKQDNKIPPEIKEFITKIKEIK